MELFESIF